MSTDDRLERLLTEVLEAGTPPRPPDRLEPETLRALRHVHRWPRWLALIKEPPMRISSSLAVGSPMARVAAIMVATLLIALMVAGAGVAGSRLLATDEPIAVDGTIIVDPSGDGDTTTITAAVAQAEDGTLILVRPGTYDEEITLSNAITIRGDGDRDEIIIEVSRPLPEGATGFEPDRPAAFRFEEADAVVENLTVRGDSSGIIVSGGSPILRGLVLDGNRPGSDVITGRESSPSAIDIVGGSTATIEKSTFLGTDISITFASAPTISGNVFMGDDESGGAEIWMEGGGVDPEIVGNTFDGNEDGHIFIWGGAKPTVQDNRFQGADIAIEIQDNGYWTSDRGTDAVVRGNTIVGADTGIMVKSGAGATIEGNEVADSETIAILIIDSEAVVRDNTIHDNVSGIRINFGSPTLDGNTLADNEIGLTLAGGADPILSGNVLCGSRIDLYVPGGPETPDTEGISISETCPD